jgi:hypothetical protein
MSVKFRELIYEKAVKGTETILKQKDDPKVSIFDILNQICSKVIKYEYDKEAQKVASGWQLSQWLAHEPDLINIVQKLNHVQFLLTDKQIYDYYFHTVPKRKRFIRWTKKSASSIQKEKEMEEFMAEHELSKREAMMILKFKERLNGR